MWEAVRDWYLPGAADERLAAALDRLRSVEGWPTTSYDGSRRQQAALKNLTSDLIGRFCSAAQTATFAAGRRPVPAPRRRGGRADRERGGDGRAQGHRRPLRDAHRRPGQRDGAAARRCWPSSSTGWSRRRADHLDRGFADDWAAAGDDAARRRVVVDQIASLTDASAVAWHARLVQP